MNQSISCVFFINTTSFLEVSYILYNRTFTKMENTECAHSKFQNKIDATCQRTGPYNKANDPRHLVQFMCSVMLCE